MSVLDVTTDPALGRLARGVVLECAGPHLVVACPDLGLTGLECDLLHTAGAATLVLASGDAVLLCVHGGATATRGVVLGRVGPSRAPDPAEPAADLPGELVVEARQSLTLRVGDGSITIRADGRILIQGKDLVSHAQRMNRIKGGAVAIN